MKRSWKDKLTQRELRHLNDQGMRTLTHIRSALKLQREAERGSFFIPCWECQEIGKKLGL